MSLVPRRVFVWFGKPSPDGGLKYHLDCLLKSFPGRTKLFVSDLLPEDLTEEDLVIPFIVPTVSELPMTLQSQLLVTHATVILNMTWECPYLQIQHLTRFGRADLLTFPSPFFKRIFPHWRTKVIPLPIREFKRKPQRKRTYRIGCIISAHPRKNHKGWVELVNSLPPPWKVVFLLPAYIWESLPPEFKALETNTRVEIIKGPIPDEELENFYHSLDWYVTLSVGEGYDIPVREALKCGVPVIAARHTGHETLPEEGVVFCETYESDGAAFGLPIPRVQVPFIPSVIKILKEIEPPEVPENLSLPTMEDWWKDWEAAYVVARQKTVELKTDERRKVVFLNDGNYYCGLRAVSSILAERLGGSVIPIYNFSSYSFPEDTIYIFPYYHGFVINGKTLPALVEWRRKNPNSTFFVWVHSVMHEDEFSLFVALGAKFLVTTGVLQSLYPCSKILPNPIGNPPKREPEKGTVLFFSLGRAHFSAEVELLSNLASLSFDRRFIFVISPTPHEREPLKFALTINHFIHVLRTRNANAQVISTPLYDDELEELVDKAEVYLVPLRQGSTGEISGELSARIPYLLRKGRPILCPYNPDRLGPYIQYLRPIFPWTEKMIHQILSSEEILKTYIPVGVPSLENEIKSIWEVLLGK